MFLDLFVHCHIKMYLTSWYMWSIYVILEPEFHSYYVNILHPIKEHMLGWICLVIYYSILLFDLQTDSILLLLSMVLYYPIKEYYLSMDCFDIILLLLLR